MNIFNPVLMDKMNSIAAIKFDKHDNEVVNSLKIGGVFEVTRQDDGGNVFLSCTAPDGVGFDFIEFDGDYEDVRSRIATPWRTLRENGESIIIGLNQDKSFLSSCGMIFISYLGDNEFVVFAEPCFSYLNKVYMPPRYTATSLSLPDNIVKRAKAIVDKVHQGDFHNLSVNECRAITFELEEIIKGKATNELRSHAQRIKSQLEKAIQEIIKRKRKSLASASFDELRRKILIQQLSDCVRDKLGDDVLSKIESESLRLATKKFGIDKSKAIHLVQNIDDVELQLLSIKEKMSRVDENGSLDEYFSQNYPPRVNIFRCADCDGYSNLKFKDQTKAKKKKAFVECSSCGKVVEGGKSGPSAIYAWNLANIRRNSIGSLSHFSLSSLSREEALKEISRFERYRALMSEHLKLTAQTLPAEKRKVLNQLKGLNSALGDYLAYAKSLLNRT